MDDGQVMGTNRYIGDIRKCLSKASELVFELEVAAELSTDASDVVARMMNARRFAQQIVNLVSKVEREDRETGAI